MKTKYLFISLLATIFALFTACENDTNGIGGSLVNDELEIDIDSTFVVEGRSIENKRIQSRTVTQLLGSIVAKGYGTFSSEYVTQFMCANKIDTTGVSVDDIDSLIVVLNIPNGDIVGDSLIPMGLEVYPLVKQLPSPIYSDFDPEGYYDPNVKLSSKIYKCNAAGENDTVQGYDCRYVYVKMPLEIAKNIFTKYKETPEMFSDPEAFTEFFPGIFVRNSYGSGRVMRIQQTSMRIHYTKHVTTSENVDTALNYVGYYFATKPEVVTNNIIKYQMSDDLKKRIDSGDNIIVAPAGRDIEITFPALDVIKAYRERAGKLAVLNALTFKLPVNEIENDYELAPPSHIMMILSKDKDNFFVENKLADGVTSFVAEYDKVNKTYSFTGLRDYMLSLLEKDEIKPEDYTFVLTPVSLVTTQEASTSYYYYYTTTETINAVVPYTSVPAMAEFDLKNAKITLTFSRQITKN
ncbi:MAG: DUF4270 family protein [Muribaculaceae bacterium]